MTDYTFHRAPRPHQLVEFTASCDAEHRALFWEMRCGKTKPIIDTAAYRHARGDLDALVVVAAPDGVQNIWKYEAGNDLPPETHRAVAWKSGRMDSRAAKAELEELLRFDGLAVLALSCHAITTEAALRYLRKFFDRRKLILVADESAWMARWSARTKKMLAMSTHRNVVARRILDGTPVDESPFDLYFPCKFLQPFKPSAGESGLLGYSTPEAFRARYGQYEEDEYGNRRKRFNHRTNTEYDVLTGYRNLSELSEKLSSFSSRLLRRDLSDAPEKVYQFRYFALTPKQRAQYDKLRGEYEIELSRGTLSVRDVMTRMTRLQMIARNYWPPERVGEPCAACGGHGYADDGTECEACAGLGARVHETELERVDTRSPALEALADELRASKGPVVIWCRFLQDVADVISFVEASGRGVGRFDGKTPPAEREAAYEAFRAGTLDALVATGSSGLTRGRDLTRATTLIYYSNGFSRRDRSQSEDRAESLDREVGTAIVDLVAEDTRDVDVITALRDKALTAAAVMGDPKRNWF